MVEASLIPIVRGISIVTFAGDPGISAIANSLQKMADHDGTPIAALYNAVPLLALPGGEAKVLIEGYYEIIPSNVEYDVYNVYSPSPALNLSGVFKLPNFIDWVRSLKLPGEYSIQQ